MSGAESHKPLALIRRLVAGLDGANVRFCHWKSNEAIRASETADNDLDLLVEPDHLEEFSAIVEQLDFKVARPQRSRQVPGLTDYLGFDEESGRIVQLQCHDRLILGDDASKNYVLPITDRYLKELERPSLLPIPQPLTEYLVLLIRLGVKHCPLDAVAQRRVGSPSPNGGSWSISNHGLIARTSKQPFPRCFLQSMSASSTRFGLPWSRTHRCSCGPPPGASCSEQSAHTPGDRQPLTWLFESSVERQGNGPGSGPPSGSRVAAW